MLVSVTALATRAPQINVQFSILTPANVAETIERELPPQPASSD